MATPKKSPPLESVDTVSSSLTSVQSVHFMEPVTFKGRTTFRSILTGKSSSTVTDNGGFVVSLNPTGITIRDPANKTTTIVGWSNILSVSVIDAAEA